jgi:CDP-paratose 2-epimerase
MRVLITGGAGFIGSNLARHFLDRNDEVTILDNLSRHSAKMNFNWLSGLGNPRLHTIVGDVREPPVLEKAVQGQDVVFHFAAQVAVTTSVSDPRTDFEINALGTFNVLEAIRALPEGSRPSLFLTSTNKVYGEMIDLPVAEFDKRYAYADLAGGVSEARPLDFHSPYGCSKGTADQYVRDYSRIYGLSTVVFRMSCIYGPRQYGTEDQGWVAHFMIATQAGRPMTIYGDGKQVRDILFVEDLIQAFSAALRDIKTVSGEVFNIGGGPANTLSLIELLEWLSKKSPKEVRYSFEDWRPGDQKIYVSNIGKARQVLHWEPRIDVHAGLEKLWSWLDKQ